MMEAKELVQFFMHKTRAALMLFVVVVGALIGFWFASSQAPTFAARILLVRSAPTSPPPGVLVDGYYVIETSRAYSEYLGVLLRDPGVRQEISEALPGLVLGRAERETQFSWRTTISSNDAVTVSTVSALLSARLAELSSESNDFVTFRAMVSAPQPYVPILTPLRALLAGGVIAFLFSVFLLLGFAYLRRT